MRLLDCKYLTHAEDIRNLMLHKNAKQFIEVVVTPVVQLSVGIETYKFKSIHIYVNMGVKGL